MKALRKRIEGSNEPEKDDIDSLSRLLIETPGAISDVYSIMSSVRSQLIKKITTGISHAYMLADIGKLKNHFGYGTSPPLERLMIDHILTLRLRLIHADLLYNEKVVGASTTAREVEFWDRLLTANQARFLKAIETLARVRRLTRNTPALQINIAQDGSQQVNMQKASDGETPTTA